MTINVDPREHLVVIGNGMAGMRTVEELLKRGGAGRFRITVFGAEPHGNYNRILLSSVLAGAASPGASPATTVQPPGISAMPGNPPGSARLTRWTACSPDRWTAVDTGEWGGTGPTNAP